MADMDIAAIVAAAVEQALAAQAADTPKPSTAKPAAKAAPKEVKRNLDPEFVPLAEGLTVRVLASGWQGGIYKTGARFAPFYVDEKRKGGGNAAKSLTLPVLALMAEHADAIASAVEKVEKRAQIGAYLVEPEVAVTA